MDGTTLYLGIHGVTTVGALITFLIRNEHRLTKLETSFDALKEQHDALTIFGTVPHATGLHKP